MFDFNASLIDVAPVSPIMFTDDFMKKGKSVDCQMILCAVSFVFTTQIEFSECRV